MATATECGPDFGPVFWPRKWVQKFECRLSRFTLLEAVLCPDSGRKNGTTSVVPAARCGRAIVQFVSIHVDDRPVFEHCTLCHAFVCPSGNLLRLACHFVSCACQWSGGARGDFVFSCHDVVGVVPRTAVLWSMVFFGGRWEPRP